MMDPICLSNSIYAFKFLPNAICDIALLIYTLLLLALPHMYHLKIIYPLLIQGKQ
jgi:hypothetical protein